MQPRLFTFLHSETDRKVCSQAASLAGLRIRHCTSESEAVKSAGKARAGLFVVDDVKAAHPLRVISDVRSARPSLLRVIWIQHSDVEPPWEVIDDVYRGSMSPRVLSLRLGTLAAELTARYALEKGAEGIAEELRERTAHLERAVEELQIAEAQTKTAYLDTIYRLALAAEYRDDDTAAHLQRISHYSVMLGSALHLTEEELFQLTYASMMHDVGKIGIPDAILLKTGRLSKVEWEVMRTHPTLGENILAGSDNRLLEASAVIAGSHHEKWDGTGYPRGLEGESIPVMGRIVAIADVFDALTAARCYKPAIGNAQACEMIRAQRGKHFDPAVVDAFFERRDQIEEAQRTVNAAQEVGEYGISHAFHGAFEAELGLDSFFLDES